MIDTVKKGFWVAFMVIVLESVLIGFFVLLAHAAQVGLVWDPLDPAPDGYQVYQRIEGGRYDYAAPVWQGAEAKCTVVGLEPATQYYFVVRAYKNDDQSGDSNEVQFKPALQAPANLRIDIEISVYIDVNGKPFIEAVQKSAP